MRARRSGRRTRRGSVDRTTPDAWTTTSSDGVRLAVSRSGDGPPLVLVPGTSADHTIFDRIRPLLEGARTVHVLDRRGYGASDDARAYTTQREHDDVAAVARAAGDGVAVYGHSFGGMCALHAAPSIPSLSALILYEPAFSLGPNPFPDPFLAELEALGREGRWDDVLTRFLHETGLSERQVTALRKRSTWAATVRSARFIVRELRGVNASYLPLQIAASVRVPTLLLAGSRSTPRRKAIAGALAAAMPNATLHWLHGQEHGAQQTAPKMLADELLAFLRGA